MDNRIKVGNEVSWGKNTTRYPITKVDIANDKVWFNPTNGNESTDYSIEAISRNIIDGYNTIYEVPGDKDLPPKILISPETSSLQKPKTRFQLISED